MNDDPFDPTREAAGAPRPEDQGEGPPTEPRREPGPGDDPDDWISEEDREARRRRRDERRRERTERVLHTQLSDDIRRVADDLRVPVSNLVRNVLEEAFGAVERVSEEVGDLLDEVLGEAEDIREDLRRRRRRPRRRRYRDDFGGPEPPEPPVPPAPPSPPATSAAPGSAGAGAYMTFPDVLGWQPLVVNGSRECACGERSLEAGDDAFVGITERGLSGSLLCAPCMRARRERQGR